jgi:hypothetical protein
MPLPLEDLEFQVAAPTPNVDVLNAPSPAWPRPRRTLTDPASTLK